MLTPVRESETSLEATPPSAAVGRCGGSTGAMGREGDHERPITLGAEGDPIAAAAADALDPATAFSPATGGAGHKAHALMAAHRRRIGRHLADRRAALALQPCCNGAGLGEGIDHQPLGSSLPHGGLILWAHREVSVGPSHPEMPRCPSQLEHQGLIDAQRISRIGPLITGHAMAEEVPRRERQHLADEGLRRQAALPPAEPIPMQPGVETCLGIAALIAGQGAAGGTGVPAGAGDGDRTGFDVVRREGQACTVGLGSNHRRSDSGPALQPRRTARASPVPMAERSEAQRPTRPSW